MKVTCLVEVVIDSDNVDNAKADIVKTLELENSSAEVLSIEEISVEIEGKKLRHIKTAYGGTAWFGTDCPLGVVGCIHDPIIDRALYSEQGGYIESNPGCSFMDVQNRCDACKGSECGGYIEDLCKYGLE